MIDRDSRLAFVGAGMVGRTLAPALGRAGYPVVAVASRSLGSARALAGSTPGCSAHAHLQAAVDDADVIFVTTPDDAIAPVVASLEWRSGQAVVHCSGAASLDVLASAGSAGCALGAFHPLQVFSSVEAATARLPGSTYVIESDERTGPYLQAMARALGGRPVLLKGEDKPLYHTSLVMVEGLLTSLVALAADMWEQFGIDREGALESILPLIEGNIDTIRAVGVPQAIAGPYVRGDVGTVRKHLDALETQAPHMLSLYCHLALAGLPLARQKGALQAEQAHEIRTMLEGILPESSCDHPAAAGRGGDAVEAHPAPRSTD